MALGSEKQCRIEEAILDGYTYEVIAKNNNVSIKTVQRIKKGLEQKNPSLAQTINDNKYSRKFSDRQAEKRKHVDELKRMYEDTEEGWIYDAAEEDWKSRQMSRTFSGIVYELNDKTRAELASKLNAMGYSGEISPIHDKDIWSHDSSPVIDKETGEVIEESGSRYKCGDRKKAHTHVMIQLDNPVTFKHFNERIHRILPDTPLWVICNSVKGYHNYLTHHTEAAMKEGKYLYDEDEIITFGDFEMIMTKKDRQMIVSMIASEIIEEEICYMYDLVKRHEHVPEEIGIIKDSSYFFKSLIDEQWRKKNPEGRISRSKMMIVEEFEHAED